MALSSNPWRVRVAALLLAVACACSPQVSEAQPRPPEGWRESLRAQTRAAAAEVRRTSEEVLRRSPDAAARPLAEAIRFSRREALRQRPQQVPAHIRQLLQPHFAPAVLDDVRWTTAGGDLGAGALLARWYYEEGAVTLDDIIVFSDAAVARNVWLWAHELAHVEQYQRLGVDGFARAYARDWRRLEAEANARAFAVTAKIREARAAAPSPMAAAADRVGRMITTEDNAPPAPPAEPQAEPPPAEPPPASPIESPSDAPGADTSEPGAPAPPQRVLP